MAVTPQPCRNCTITVATKSILGIIDASVSLSTETIDVSEITSIDRVHIAGMRSGTISGNVFYDHGDDGIVELEGAIKSGNGVEFIFTLHSGATYTVTAIVTSWTPSIAVNDVVRASFSAQFAGECTISA